jgi:UDPglucose 6-dehydrogenase
MGFDFDAGTVGKLQQGVPPLFEPGLVELVRQGQDSGHLAFTTQPEVAFADAEVVWIAYDTPIDLDDQADVEFVLNQAKRIFPFLAGGTMVLISSQMPVGSTRLMETSFAALCPGKKVTFAYSPENLRLGKAIQTFMMPDRVVVGVRSPSERELIAKLLRPFTTQIEWMSVESAEMTKHALNAFLASSITFINELAVLCEGVGADAKEVERGLKSEVRIGPKAYLSPGGSFAGGTLARDISFLMRMGADRSISTPLLSSVRVSNEVHKGWADRKLVELLGAFQGKKIAVWGLAYKAGTDTLRRSSSVELCLRLAAQGVAVQVHDPVVQVLPEDLAAAVTLHKTAEGALVGAHALVVATEWPDYRVIDSDAVVALMEQANVVDANRFLAATLGRDARVRYAAVGKPNL